jgi:tRNA_anti-like
MQKKILFFAGIVLCLVILASIALYWYQKPRASLINVKPAYTLSAKDLYTAFEQNEKKANQQFLEKVILVKGTVDNVRVTDSTVSVLLSSGNEMGGVNCSVRKSKNDKQALPTKGGFIQVKGRCIGFLMDVNLVDAVIEP